MVGILKILGLVVVTSLGLALFNFGGNLHIAGYPLVDVAQKGARGLIALGQVDARGVIVLAQNGYGLVTVAQGGVGVIFGVGQLMAGLLAIGQLGIGLLFFFGQVGFGIRGVGQVAGMNPGGDYLNEMSAEFTELLSFRRTK